MPPSVAMFTETAELQMPPSFRGILAINNVRRRVEMDGISAPYISLVNQYSKSEPINFMSKCCTCSNCPYCVLARANRDHYDKGCFSFSQLQ